MRTGKETLHLHTTNSDGELTHLQALNLAERYGVAVVAFTDHDSLPTPETLEINRKHKTKWISGIEMSSGFPSELGGGPASSFHILGLFVDPTDKNLQEYCQVSQEARDIRMTEMVSNLQNVGFTISVDECRRASDGEAIGRPHIVKALNMHESNIEVIDDLRKQMEQAAEDDPTLQQRYQFMMQRGPHQYPYTLFLSRGSFVNAYVDYRFWTDMDKTVSLIRNAGGLAVLAHYFTVRNEISPELLESIFQENRLDGAETVYGLRIYGTDQGKTVDESRGLLRSLIGKYNKVATGGADIHKIEDFIDFTIAKQYWPETVGMAEKLINRVEPNKWHSLPRCKSKCFASES